MKKVCLTQTLNAFYLAFALLFMSTTQILAQGVTTSSITGIILDAKGAPVPFAVVTATHVPSGSVYGIETSEDGRFTLPAVRIGGPYTIAVQLAGLKMKDPTEGQNIFLSLGESYNFKTTLVEEATILETVVVTTDRNGIINGSKNGTGTNIDKQQLTSLPTLSRSFESFLRLTPQGKSSSAGSAAGGGISFAGQDPRFNNLTIDGSIFNNSFGLANGNGGQTNSQPISIDAIDQIQVNVAPYDVRQAGFTGAGINAVTKSGTNNLYVNIFSNYRNQNLYGTKADQNTLVIPNFEIKQYGASIGGPLIKNKLFFFANYEAERRADPTIITASKGVTDTSATTNRRISAATLDSLSNFLQTKYQYYTGAYDNYSLATQSDKAVLKLDWNIDNNNHASFRVNYLNSKRDVSASSSGSVSGSRNGSVTSGISFQNTNYIINNDLYSGIFELNSVINRKVSNNFQVGYTYNKDYRSSGGGLFPTVDIQGPDGKTLITFGYEPFTLDNKLFSTTVQVKDDVSFYLKNHTVTAGINFEAFQFENSFKPRYEGIYTFANLPDFYDAANGTRNPILKQFRQTTPTALDGGDIPFSITRAYQPGVYIQDEFKSIQDRLRVTVGMRLDVPTFGESTAIQNTEAAGFKFLDENGQPLQANTAQLPTTQYLFSPRLGFNFDVKGDKTLQLRGGSGLFTGRPAFVWISNAVGNNGVIQGEILANNTTIYPFSPDYKKYFPANGTATATYNLATVDPDFKWPQTWRTNLGVDVKLPYGLVGTLEGLYSKVVNNINYINSNQVLPLPINSYKASSGENDTRPTFGFNDKGVFVDSLSKIKSKVTDNTVLRNTNQGFSYSFTAKIEKPFRNSNWYAMLAYNYGLSKDIITGGSIANSSWTGNYSVNGNNRPDLALSDFDLRHRIVGGFTYNLPEGNIGSTMISLFLQSNPIGNTQFTIVGDANGDGLSGNDLMYVPNDAKNLQFDQQTATINGIKYTFNAAQQAGFLNGFIDGNEYLCSRRGQYAERNGWVLPFLTTLDLTVAQNFYVAVKEKKNTIQIRMDIYNLGNLINNAWGVGQSAFTQPLQFSRFDATTNQPVYKITSTAAYYNSDGTFRTNALIPSANFRSDVWQLQLGVRYIFN